MEEKENINELKLSLLDLMRVYEALDKKIDSLYQLPESPRRDIEIDEYSRTQGKIGSIMFTFIPKVI